MINVPNNSENCIIVGNGTSVLDAELGDKIDSFDNLKYNTDNEEAYSNFSLIYFKVTKLECLQLSDIKNIRVEFVYTESSNKKYYMVP